ncbi:unnamed protein product [Rhizophagus irregularis]|nr:unnamed protein product [Rhizophagus irregularis]
MEQWRRSSRYVEEIHKQDLMQEFLTSNPDATSLAPESASALASIDQDIEQDGRADDVKQYIKKYRGKIT